MTERDERAAKTHTGADQVHDIDGTNAREAWASQHAEKADETEREQNEEDATGCGAIVHKIPFGRGEAVSSLR